MSIVFLLYVDFLRLVEALRLVCILNDKGICLAGKVPGCGDVSSIASPWFLMGTTSTLLVAYLK